MNRITTVATSAAFQPMGMIGKVSPEAEEAEEEAADNSFRARMERLEAEARLPFTETELADRESTFRYLKEYRKRKRLGLEHTFECQEEARERARAEVDRILREEAERSTRESEGTMSEEAMMESAGVGIAYLEDENGKLTKRRTTVLRRTPTRRKTPTTRRTPAGGIHDDTYVKDENGVPPPRQFTQADRERVDKNRERYTRTAWGKELRAIAEGRLTMTKEQFQAHLAYGRFRGWNRRPSVK